MEPRHGHRDHGRGRFDYFLLDRDGGSAMGSECCRVAGLRQRRGAGDPGKRGGDMTAIVPVARTPIAIRLATAADYPFIDRLQDMHSKALGFMPKAQLEGKINAGHVLIAEEDVSADCADLRRLNTNALNLRESAQSADHSAL